MNTYDPYSLANDPSVPIPTQHLSSVLKALKRATPPRMEAAACVAEPRQRPIKPAGLK